MADVFLGLFKITKLPAVVMNRHEWGAFYRGD